jgi:thioredoxin-dependent peroxiredoxin
MSTGMVPDVTLESDEGSVKLREIIANKVIVLYFYPKDETPGCTAQACAFRDAYQDFTDAGADVIGVSSDSSSSHDSFKQHHRLPFRLLSDPGGKAAAAMGVKKTLGILPGRVTFIIDQNGDIAHQFSSQLQVGKHIKEALAVVKRLAAVK